jgi:spore germination cell wall hydrolase CwlJ-like protein
VDDLTALALNGFQEANLEPDDGLAAVCQVVLNRAKLHYQSDGTIQGAIFWPNAFSWTGWDMVNGKYTKVAFTPEEEQARAADLLARAEMYHDAWARALRIAGEVQAGTYNSAAFDKITPQTVLYLNPRIVPHLPAWADPSKLVTTIGRHEFFHV